MFKKCKVLRVASVRSAVDRPDYFLRGINKLDHVASEKDLGMLMSHDLSWNKHVHLITSKVQRCSISFIVHVKKYNMGSQRQFLRNTKHFLSYPEYFLIS